MARVKLNSLLADLRGRLGAAVFSSNGAGFYAKELKIPVNPRSTAQSASRSTFSRLVKSWSLLDEADRLLWATFAADPTNTRYDWFGDPYNPNARAQFVSINTYRLLAGLPVTESPPEDPLPLDLPAFLAGVDVPGTSFDSYADPDAAFDASISYVHIALAISPSPGRGSTPNNFKNIAVVPYTGPWPYVFKDWLTATYGPIPNYGRWFMALTPLSSECRPGTVARLTAALGEEA
jgi:hypothetical protein